MNKYTLIPVVGLTEKDAICYGRFINTMVGAGSGFYEIAVHRGKKIKVKAIKLISEEQYIEFMRMENEQNK